MIGVARDGLRNRRGRVVGRISGVPLTLMSVVGTDPPLSQGRVEHRRGQLPPAYFLGAFFLGAFFFLRSAQ